MEAGGCFAGTLCCRNACNSHSSFPTANVCLMLHSLTFCVLLTLHFPNEQALLCRFPNPELVVADSLDVLLEVVEVVVGFQQLATLELEVELPWPSFPCLFAKQMAKKGKDQGKKSKAKKQIPVFLSVFLRFLRGSFDPPKRKDLKCKEFSQNARIFFSLLKELQELHSAMKANKLRDKERERETVK